MGERSQCPDGDTDRNLGVPPAWADKIGTLPGNSQGSQVHFYNTDLNNFLDRVRARWGLPTCHPQVETQGTSVVCVVNCHGYGGLPPFRLGVSPHYVY